MPREQVSITFRNRFGDDESTLVSSGMKDGRRWESAGNSEKADRLSALPTPLLHHILSFLSTREAVQTCVLSRRWEDVWTSIPCLEFCDVYFPYPPISPMNSDYEAEQKQQEETQFHDFIDQVLIRRDGSNLRKFCLWLDIGNWKRYVHKWVCYAVNHFVEQIELNFCTSFESERYGPPRQLFACESLVDMNLDMEGCYLKLPTRINLPNLQSLKLANLNAPDNGIQRLLHSCPKLKILSLTDCCLPNAEIFDVSRCSCLESLSLEGNDLCDAKMISISAPKLKSFTIKSTMVSCDNCSLKISTPSLLYLEYNDYVDEPLCVENLRNLLNAVVDLNFVQNLIDGAVGWGLEFLKGLEHVRTLRLWPSSMEILSRATDLGMHMPTSFTNLKFLELMIDKVKIDEFKAIACLLLFCPSIETLVIEVKGDNDGGSWESDYFPSEFCKLYNLKEVEIRHHEESNIELNLIKLLLQCAMVLERIIVAAPKIDLQKRKEISQKLLTYPRASLKTSILFS